MSSALILFAHGARDPEWARPVQAVTSILRARFPEHAVEVAFLEFLQPSLPELVARLVNVTPPGQLLRVDVLPFFIAQGGHLRKELPEMIAALTARYPTLEFKLMTPLGELPEVQAAMAEAIAALVKY